MSGSASGGANEILVVASGEAYSVAERWLNEMGGADGGNDADAEEVDLSSRPPRLGLGAPFLPHRQVMGLMLPVEKRLSAKLRKHRRGDGSDDSDDDGALKAGPASKQPGGVGKGKTKEVARGGPGKSQQPLPAHKQQPASASAGRGKAVMNTARDSESDEDEEDSRVAALGKMQKKRANPSLEELKSVKLTRKRRQRS